RRRAAPGALARPVRRARGERPGCHPTVGHRRARRRAAHPHGGLLMNKVVLAYSGGLDTSVAVAWLKEQYGAEVITLTVDLGGGAIREGIERRAMRDGASQA